MSWSSYSSSSGSAITTGSLVPTSLETDGDMKVKGDVEVDGRIKGQTQLPLIAVDNERGPATVNLPKEPQEGDFLIIKDVKGMATVNNITIQGHHSIDGQDRFILTIDREAVHVVFSGKFSDPDEPGQWYVI